MSAHLVLGVDAGNSKTLAAVADLRGQIVGVGRSGIGDIYGAGGEDGAVTQVLAAVDAALAAAGCSRSALRHSALCLAGIDWPADVTFWEESLDLVAWPGTRSIRNDAFALLRAGASEGVGVALSAGTGSAVGARGPAGAEWSGSWWITHPMGGSALGESALDAICRAELGLAPPTALADAVCHQARVASATELIEQATGRPPWSQARVAGLARVVLACAASGDAVAAEIVRAQGEAYGLYAAVAVRKVGLDAGGPLRVTLGGSVHASELPALREATEAGVRAQLPGAHIAVTSRHPVLGAVLQALAEQAPDASLTQDVLTRVDATRLDADLVRT